MWLKRDVKVSMTCNLSVRDMYLTHEILKKKKNVNNSLSNTTIKAGQRPAAKKEEESDTKELLLRRLARCLSGTVDTKMNETRSLPTRNLLSIRRCKH